MFRICGNRAVFFCETVLLFFFWHLGDADAKNIWVGANQKFTKIAQALSFANNGDTISIKKGIYSEGTLIISKTITLLGEDYPILTGEGKSEILIVRADGVLIKGFVFQNAGISFIHDNAAVRLEGVKNCTVEGNKFLNNFFGVYLAKSSNCKIINNEISASGTKETFSGNGIHLWYCSNIIIRGNSIKGHRDGMYFEFVRHSTIENNLSEKNLRYGLHFMFSDSCSYSSNTFVNNGAGVAVMYTHYVSMTNNKFEHNWGGASYGLLLKEISNSRIEKNLFYKNSSGIYFEGCNRISTKQNNFVENGWAIRLMANSMENSFEHNNFIGNSFDISTNSVQSNNSFNNNYWSNYKGYDLNKDRTGDVPYRPVKLFSVIIERNRPTLILLRSFFVELLNIAENIFPTLTPNTLLDNKPAMRKF